MKTFRLLACIIGLISSPNALAFSDWETETPATSPSFETYQPPHDSHASGDGVIHIAFVRNNGSRDILYYLKKETYAPPPRFGVSPVPTPISNGSKILSIAIRHNPSTGRTHFAYTTEAGSNTRVYYTSLIPGAMPGATLELVAVTATSVTTPLSLELAPTPGAPPSPAICFHNVLNNKIEYHKKLAPDSWATETVFTQSGIFGIPLRADLAYDSSGNPSVAFEAVHDSDGGTIRYATRNPAGTWEAQFVSTFSGIRGKSPALCIDGTTAYITYVESDVNSSYDRLVLVTGSSMGFSLDPSIISQVPGSDHFIPAISISAGRLLITYNKFTVGSLSDPSPQIYLRHSDGLAETMTLPPPSSASPTFVESPGSIAMSLDTHGYPIITWNTGSGSPVHTAFSPDWTDRDCDGVIRLQELAQRMDPDTPDAHLLPQLTPVAGSLALTYRTDFTGSIFEDQTVRGILFDYIPEYSTDGRTWSRDPARFRSSVSGNSATLRSTNLLGTPGTPREFLRIRVFRK